MSGAEACPECGVAAWGNGFCATCRAHWPPRLLERVQRRAGCNQDDEPADWDVPCSTCCVCAEQAASIARSEGSA